MTQQIKGEIIPIEELQLPDILYKYKCFDGNYHEKALFENELYLPSANKFNDPFDSKIPFRYPEEDLTEENIQKKTFLIAQEMAPDLSKIQHEEMAIRMQKENLLNESHHLEQVDKATFKRLCSDFGILSLTPNEKNILMWSYYSNSHKGFCIGYNAKYLIQSRIFGSGGMVAYSNDFPKMPLFPTRDDNAILNLLFTKGKVWEHEEEYRLIHRYKNSNTRILPTEAISEVILGCQIPEQDRVNYALKIQGVLPNVEIFQIEQSKTNFSLEKIPVLDKAHSIDFKKKS